eukprot:6176561-Pleurochrysis_carterae.AAC.2
MQHAAHHIDMNSPFLSRGVLNCGSALIGSAIKKVNQGLFRAGDIQRPLLLRGIGIASKPGSCRRQEPTMRVGEDRERV